MSQQPYTVHIRNNATREVRDMRWDQPGLGFDLDVERDTGSESFIWTEGNYACDCNRFLFFERAGGREPDMDERGQCGDKRYTITHLTLDDGTKVEIDGFDA